MLRKGDEEHVKSIANANTISFLPGLHPHVRTYHSVSRNT
jgi:hypothetical protein